MLTSPFPLPIIIQNVTWNFDDGNIISGAASSNNQYISNGVYYPIATVESNNGCIQSIVPQILSV